VNALQYFFLPDYEETITFIKSAPEEREREESFRLKKLKKKNVAPFGQEERPKDDFEETFLEVSGDISMG
jgi:ATP synthase subunit D